MQALSLFIQASPKSLDKARAQLQQAKAALEAINSTQATIAGTDAPCIYPDLCLMYMTAPTPVVQPLSSDAARVAMRTSVDCLLEACSLRNMADFRAVMLLAEHVLVSCDLAIVRGAIYLLILPPLVADEDELPDWSPTPRRFAQQLHLPFSLTSQVLAMLSFATLYETLRELHHAHAGQFVLQKRFRQLTTCHLQTHLQ